MPEPSNGPQEIVHLEDQLNLLNAKVDLLTARMEQITEILETLREIKVQMELTADEKVPLKNPATNKKTKENQPTQHKEVRLEDQNKQVKFDVDAFLDLG